MFTPLLPALAAIALCVAPLQADDTAKARLKSALDATGLKYETSPSGLSFTVLFDHPNSRQQKVFVATAPGKPGGLVTHPIYTTVWVNKETPPDETTMRKVLSQTKKLGAFHITKDSKGVWGIRFQVHFDATGLKDTSERGDTLSTTLKDLIYFVNAVGEETDKQLNSDKDIKG